MTKPKNATDALMAFISTIEATEGVIINEEGFYAPVVDPEWIDLGHAYVEACELLNRKPVISRGCEMRLTDREVGTVLAALRLWQSLAKGKDLEAIATNDGEFVKLSNDEIDDLCERLNE